MLFLVTAENGDQLSNDEFGDLIHNKRTDSYFTHLISLSEHSILLCEFSIIFKIFSFKEIFSKTLNNFIKAYIIPYHVEITFAT